ncbi:hypothetical protein ACIQZB_39110 [Streptomyces sp. NPDC097727]|uniref:hypothetical protein n=1 Tax=Streptomyces sp. NPDC097727 TaxID=3366092 RepID=UPI003822D603
MGRDNWHVERTRHSPWGALTLVLLTGLAWMQNGADFSLGPPRPAAATSVDLHRAAPEVPGGGPVRDVAAARAGVGAGTG